MKAYRWTKKRREARARLITLAIFSILIAPMSSTVTTAITPSTAHPTWLAIWGLLILVGFYLIATDIRILIFDDTGEL